ncbi:MAG: 1,6-anhydro-N-acetylmuramyl-L-alanine amidase AmpD [Gammaproteobacteria bacterium]
MSAAGFDAAGWLGGVRRVPSPNFDERPAGQAVELIVVHAISLPPGVFGGGFVEDLFTNRLDPAAHPYFAGIDDLRVSAHFLVDRAGRVTQFVPIGQRAWHAGQSSWCGREACNDFAVGIELEGAEDQSFTAAQYASLDALVAALRRACPAIGEGAVVGHADVAPGRKTDPGPLFDWSRLASAQTA